MGGREHHPMPPRISEFPCLKALKSALPSNNGPQVARPLRAFSSTPHPAKGATTGQQRRYRDPYIVAQARARKAANLSKQEALRISRARALGDPVRGVETEFVKSFDTARGTGKHADKSAYLNNFLTQTEIDEQLAASKQLVEPAPQTKRDLNYNPTTGEQEERALRDLEAKNARNKEMWEQAHGTVQEAIKRITDVDNGNSKDRFRINVERCIDTFGRHQTDKILPGRPLPIPLGPGGAPLMDHEHEVAPLKERKGPDTGSSEVQIAILTAKIRNLANHLERVGNSDKINKRNLRLLVHRRQKLLQYLRRKERAGPRWQRCIETLGLTEGTWRGEITL